jgi:hypothetical protein
MLCSKSRILTSPFLFFLSENFRGKKSQCPRVFTIETPMLWSKSRTLTSPYLFFLSENVALVLSRVNLVLGRVILALIPENVATACRVKALISFSVNPMLRT